MRRKSSKDEQNTLPLGVLGKGGSLKNKSLPLDGEAETVSCEHPVSTYHLLYSSAPFLSLYTKMLTEDEFQSETALCQMNLRRDTRVSSISAVQINPAGQEFEVVVAHFTNTLMVRKALMVVSLTEFLYRETIQFMSN